MGWSNVVPFGKSEDKEEEEIVQDFSKESIVRDLMFIKYPQIYNALLYSNIFFE